MPVGKNSLKRVTNSGYSNVKTDAPDMENSTVEEPVKEAPKPRAAAPVAKKPATKAPVKKAAPMAKPKTESEPQPTPVLYGAKYAIGEDMPIYLL